MLRVAVLDDYSHLAQGLADWDSLPDTQVEFFHDAVKDADALVDRLRPFDVIVITRERTRFLAPVLEGLPNLKLIAGTGRRQVHVDVVTATRRGVLVCTTGGGIGSTMELAWGLILALTRHIGWEDQQMRRGRWQTRVGFGLAGKTLGILGMGHIGTEMAHAAQVFRLNVIAWGPTLTPERAQEHYATYVSWDELFARSDILTIHVPLTDLSRGWITERELRLMKPTAYLINTSRGPIVEEAALLKVLQEKTIAGAALDVFDEEPLPADHPLLELENVVLTPHLGYACFETLQTFFQESVENIRGYLQGAPQNVLNPEAQGRG